MWPVWLVDLVVSHSRSWVKRGICCSRARGAWKDRKCSRHHPSIQPTTNSSRDSGDDDDDAAAGDDAGDGGDDVVRQRRANPDRERGREGGELRKIPMA